MKNFQAVAVDAIEIIETLVRQFPGLLDGEQDVSGSELVSALTEAIQNSKKHKQIFGEEMKPELLKELIREAEEMAERHVDDRIKNRAAGSADAELDCLKAERATRSTIRRARKALTGMEGKARNTN